MYTCHMRTDKDMSKSHLAGCQYGKHDMTEAVRAAYAGVLGADP